MAQKIRYRNTTRRIVGVEIAGVSYNVYPNSTIVDGTGLLSRHPAFERVGPVKEATPAPPPAPTPPAPPAENPAPAPTQTETPAPVQASQDGSAQEPAQSGGSDEKTQTPATPAKVDITVSSSKGGKGGKK